MSDPLVSSMNVHSSQEPFVNLVHFDPDIIVDPSLSNSSRYFSFVRLSVASRLSLAKNFLPKGVRFFIRKDIDLYIFNSKPLNGHYNELQIKI